MTETPRVAVTTVEMDANIPFNTDSLLGVQSGQEHQLRKSYKIMYLLLHYNLKAA